MINSFNHKKSPVSLCTEKNSKSFMQSKAFLRLYFHNNVSRDKNGVEIFNHK